MNITGFRSHKTIINKDTGVLDTHGAYMYCEVTSATDTNFYPNAFDADGVAVNIVIDPIPLKAGITRAIPMAIYNFKADAPVTLVAFRM